MAIAPDFLDWTFANDWFCYWIAVTEVKLPDFVFLCRFSALEENKVWHFFVIGVR